MVKMKTNVIIEFNKDNHAELRYIGYYKLLDKILDLMDTCDYKNKLLLIDKYIELVKVLKKEVKNEIK